MREEIVNRRLEDQQNADPDFDSETVIRERTEWMCRHYPEFFSGMLRNNLRPDDSVHDEVVAKLLDRQAGSARSILDRRVGSAVLPATETDKNAIS